MSDSLQPHGLQHARPPCPSPSPKVCSNSHPSSRWCHPTISSSVTSFSSCLRSFPTSESFPMSQFSHQVVKVLDTWEVSDTEVSHCRTQWEDGSLWNRKQVHLFLGQWLPASISVRSRFPFLATQPASLWYFYFYCRILNGLRQWWWLHNIENVLNATDCTLKNY